MVVFVRLLTDRPSTQVSVASILVVFFFLEEDEVDCCRCIAPCPLLVVAVGVVEWGSKFVQCEGRLVGRRASCV